MPTLTVRFAPPADFCSSSFTHVLRFDLFGRWPAFSGRGSPLWLPCFRAIAFVRRPPGQPQGTAPTWFSAVPIYLRLPSRQNIVHRWKLVEVQDTLFQSFAGCFADH